MHEQSNILLPDFSSLLIGLGQSHDVIVQIHIVLDRRNVRSCDEIRLMHKA